MQFKQMVLGNHKKFIVYRIDLYGYFYFGFTQSFYGREFSHAKTIHALIKNGTYNSQKVVAGATLFSHKISCYIVDNKLRRSLKEIRRIIQLDVVYSSGSKEQSLLVEAFLIKQSLMNKKCCNKRSDLEEIKKRIPIKLLNI